MLSINRFWLLSASGHLEILVNFWTHKNKPTTNNTQIPPMISQKNVLCRFGLWNLNVG